MPSSKKDGKIWLVGFIVLIGLIGLIVGLCVSKSKSGTSENFRYQRAYTDGYGPAPNRFMGVPVPKGALKDTNPRYKVAETAAAYGIPFNVALGKAPLRYFDKFGNSLLNGKGVQQRNDYYQPSPVSASVAFTDIASNVPTAGFERKAWDWQYFLKPTQTPFFTANDWNRQPVYGTTPWNRAQFGVLSNPYDRMPRGVASTDFFKPFGPNFLQRQSVPFFSSVNSWAPIPEVPGPYEKVGMLIQEGTNGSDSKMLNLYAKAIAPLQDLFEYQAQDKDGFVLPLKEKYLEDGDVVSNVPGKPGIWKVNLFNQNKYVYM